MPGFDFARAFLDCRNVVTCLFGEHEVDEFTVETELHYHNEETERDKRCGKGGHKEEQHHTRKRECNGEVNPAEERIGVKFERLDVCSFAAAILFQDVRHILARLLLAFAAGTALFAFLNDGGYTVYHILRTFGFFVDKFAEISHNTLLKVPKIS